MKLLSKKEILKIKRIDKIKSKNVCGIYFLIYKNKIVYIGSSMDLRKRVETHIKQNKKRFNYFSFIKIKKVHLLQQYEADYIFKFFPIYNMMISNTNFYNFIFDNYNVSNIHNFECRKFTMECVSLNGKVYMNPLSIKDIEKPKFLDDVEENK